jgi:putative PIN family toxin of toxin-antitoxin system
MRLVLDTDVLVAAFRSERGASRELLIAALDERYALLASTALWLEYEAVLVRPSHLKAMRLNAAEVGDVLAALALVAEPVPIHFLWRPVLADAEDEHVLDLAMNGRADMLVTFNQDDFAEASKTFQIEVVTPAAALRRVRE